MLFTSHAGNANGSYGAYDPNSTFGAYNPADVSAAATYGYGGFGAALVQGTGKDFNCNSVICYGIGKTNDDLFKTLQMKINVLAGPAGIAPLLVDGFIGAKTVTTLLALSKIGVPPMAATKEGVATAAPSIIDALDGIIQARVAANQPVAPPGTPVTFTPPTPQTVAVATQAITAQIPGGAAASASAAMPKKSKTLLLVAGGIAAALVVGGVGYYVYRRKAQREG
jgi:hypothetical protein